MILIPNKQMSASCRVSLCDSFHQLKVDDSWILLRLKTGERENDRLKVSRNLTGKRVLNPSFGRATHQ
jgi:hypothetical protein